METAHRALQEMDMFLFFLGFQWLFGTSGQPSDGDGGFEASGPQLDPNG